MMRKRCLIVSAVVLFTMLSALRVDTDRAYAGNAKEITVSGDSGKKEERGDSSSGNSDKNEKDRNDFASEDSESEKDGSRDKKQASGIEFWSEDSEAAASIMEYVADVTDLKSEGYIPVEDRIAVFDLDGTLMGERAPSYFELMMFLHRVLYDEDYEASGDMLRFAEKIEECLPTGEYPKNFDKKQMRYEAEAFEGMSVEELKEYTRAFMESEADGFEGLKRGEAFFKPMVSLVEYLTENDFECYIVSGSERTIIRTLIEDRLPIPASRVIGTSRTIEASGQQGDEGGYYQYDAEDELVIGSGMSATNVKMNKVSGIELEIGKVPVLAFGNSEGDISMAQYTVNNSDYEGRAYMLLCDDLDREHGDMETADSLRETCEERGFETISMHDDFDTIYGMDVKTTDYAYDKASDAESADDESAGNKTGKKDKNRAEDKAEKKDRDKAASENKAEEKDRNKAASGNKAEEKDGDKAEAEDKAGVKDGEKADAEDKTGVKDRDRTEEDKEDKGDKKEDKKAEREDKKNKEKNRDKDKVSENEADDEAGKESGQEDYTQKSVKVYKEGLTDEKISVRYYDGQPNVPYIGIKAYYDCFMAESLDEEKPSMSVEKKEDGTYLLKNPYGEALADVEKGTLSSKDIYGFTNLMSLVRPGLENCYYDGIPYVRVKEVDTKGKGEATLDLGKYNINIHADETDVYFPESTLSDIFSDLRYHYTAFDGDTLYFYLSLDEVQKHENSEFVKALESKLDEDLNRPEDLAEYAFNELCFSIENFYGFPGKAMLNDDIREEGLEKALNDYSEAGKKTVELLKSPGIPDYLYGMSKLGLFLNDGGHTYLTWTLPKDFEDEGIREEYDKLAKELDPLFEEVQSEADKRKMDVSEYLARRKMRNDSYDGSRYLKDGDTAVFVLDSFMGFDMEAWSAYYDGEGDKPTADTVSGDDIVLIHDALIDADKDPDIVNFVIDCSNNTGGSADEVAMLVSLITGERETEIRLEDTQTGQIRTEVYEADTNFDGSFDEEDDFEPYDLNFAILTSSTSFSCGNLFPALMREKGYMIMGERSGGGACAVMQQTTGDGLNYQMSSCRMKLLDIEGSSIDNGIPVDVDLVPKKSDGSDKTVLEKDVLLSKEDGPQELRVIDYSEFYNIERLSDEINGFYEEEAAEDKAA